MAANQQFEIEVDGEVELLLPAERAILSIRVEKMDHDKAKATESVIESAKKVEALLRKISTQDNGQVSAADYWSRTSLRETSHAPYDSDKKVYLPREYTALISYSVRMQKFNGLGPAIRELVAIEHVSTHGVEWVLTAATMEAQRSKLRVLSAQNALRKAQDYASTLGYDKVVPFKLTEKHQYTHTTSRKGGGVTRIPKSDMETQTKNMAEAEDWEDVGEEVFQYTPEEVKMTQSCNAEFRAE
ncbi:hypothetical protein LTR37_011585 [Vermiconidia calcicola]|uniref:Uncharacterized protein n=1 Tax=Vermiconidia calcicola TaxID=1690605 RepID=A0ACC3N293_9PEZI|nr:hypothetical protein LTR37_011585 [Vermiconidia calcicola]